MIHSSQSFNPSYGYLWWLNGQDSYMAPQRQYIFPQELFPDAPADLFAALGKNDQKIYIVPSRNMVVVRVGNAAYTSVLAFSDFDNQLWSYLDSLACTPTLIREIDESRNSLSVFPNPANGSFTIKLPQQVFDMEIFDLTGRKILSQTNVKEETVINCARWQHGVYFLEVKTGNEQLRRKIIRE